MSKLFDKYWMIIVVGMFLILTSLYHEFGIDKSVFWNTFIKTNRAVLIMILLYQCTKYVGNVISVLFSFGLISYYIALTIIRYVCAFKSNFNYEVYYELMQSGNLSMMLNIFIFVSLVIIKYFEILINYVLKLWNGLKRIL